MQNIKEKITKVLNIDLITKLVLIYVLLQPMFDILSFLSIRNLIPIGISTYAKPLFVFGIGIYIFLTNKEARSSYTKVYIAYAILMVVHCLILKDILVKNDVILHEIRFMINIVYMIVLFMIMDFIYKNNSNKEKFIKNLKKVLVITFLTYCTTIIIAILTGTSGRTYEYADALKDGFKGWLDSGQIFGHALSITLPFLIYYIFNLKSNNKLVNILSRISIVIPTIVLLLIGTKVTYFIALIVLFSHFILDLIYFIKDKDKNLIISSMGCLIVLIASVAVYNYLPVKKNIEINVKVLEEDMRDYAKGLETKRKDLVAISNEIEQAKKSGKVDSRIQRLQNYYNWDLKSSQILEQKYANGTLHPGDMRGRQLVYNFNKYKFSSIQYKLFGLGYLNQPDQLSIERDLLMIIFSFGLIGFLTVLLKPILIWIKSSFKILKNLKKINLETLYLFEGFSIFFCISVYAGYTYIYTNFSIFLVILILLLKDSLKLDDDNKKVLFISSTGGHLSELLQLKPMFTKYDSYIITEYDESTKALKESYKNKISYLVYGTRSKLLTYIFKFIYNCLKSLVLYIKIRPKYIITTGTHTAVPMCYIGKLFGSKIIFIETFANRNSKTLSGRLVYPVADLFIVQWEEMLKLYPKAKLGGSIY